MLKGRKTEIKKKQKQQKCSKWQPLKSITQDNKKRKRHSGRPLWNYPGTMAGACHILSKTCLLACIEILRPSQQLRSFQAGQLPINTVPGGA